MTSPEPSIPAAPSESAPAPASRPKGWFNRNVVGMGITSLFADLCYESAGAALPSLWKALGAPAYALGLTEGAADMFSNFAKLASGWWSDRWGKRKPLVVLGYAVTTAGIGLIALATVWPVVLLCRVVAWIGKGLRGPPRNALLTDSVAAADRGKAFGVHRTADTIGAIIGPLFAAWLIRRVGLGGIGANDGLRSVFLWALVPGTVSVLAMAFLVRDPGRSGPARRPFFASVKALPTPFRRFLAAVGVFGAGDFSHTLLILAAVEALTPRLGLTEAAATGATLLALRNTIAALTAFPVGWASDHMGRRGLLAGGYALGVLVIAGFAVAMGRGETSALLFALLFSGAGIFTAVEETLEGATAADLVPDATLRGTAFGVLGAVNGVGDVVASLAVGLLWAISPAVGLSYAAVTMAAGTAMLAIPGRGAPRAPASV